MGQRILGLENIFRLSEKVAVTKNRTKIFNIESPEINNPISKGSISVFSLKGVCRTLSYLKCCNTANRTHFNKKNKDFITKGSEPAAFTPVIDSCVRNESR